MRRPRTSVLGDRIHERLDHAIDLVRELAVRGEETDRRIDSLGPTSLRARLTTFHDQAHTDQSPELHAAIAAVERQLDTAERLRVCSSMTAIGLSRAVDRFDQLAARAEDSGFDGIDGLLADADALIEELVQVRASLDRTSTWGPDAAAGSTDQ